MEAGPAGSLLANHSGPPMVCVLELAMLVIGLIAVITGKYDWALREPLRGPAVRIAGVVLMLPVPLAFAIGVIIAATASDPRQGLDPREMTLPLILVELGIVLACLAIAAVILVAFGRSPGRARHRARRVASRRRAQPAPVAEEEPLEGVPVEEWEVSGVQTEPRPPRPTVPPPRHPPRRRRPAPLPYDDLPGEEKTEFTPISSSMVRWIVGGVMVGALVLAGLCAGGGIWSSLKQYEARQNAGRPVAQLAGPDERPPLPPQGPRQPPVLAPGPGAPRPAAPPPAREPPKPAWEAHPPFAVDPNLQGAQGVVYLGDLQEFDVQAGPWPFAKHGELGDPDHHAIVVGGRRSPHGLSMHAPNRPDKAHARFALGKKAQVLKATVALNDTAPPNGGAVRFFVTGDGKELWHSEVIRPHGPPESCSVDVGGVEVLELSVRAEGSHFGVHAVWVEPRLFTDRAEAEREPRPDLPPVAGPGGRP